VEYLDVNEENNALIALYEADCRKPSLCCLFRHPQPRTHLFIC
jgi:hypothetical protein